MKLFTKWFKKGPTVEERALGPQVNSKLELFLQNYNTQGLNESQILRMVGTNPVFFSCVNLIANSVASVEYTVNDPKIERILDKPNSNHSKNTFLWLVSAYLSTLGRVYIYVRKDKSLLTVSPLNIFHTGGFGYQFRHGQETIDAVLYDNLICITAPDLESPFAGGTGLGHVLSQELDISEAASTHELAYLKNHARPDMLVNYAGMTDDNLIALKSSWDKAHKGTKSSGGAGFSNADKLDVQTLTSSFKDLGLDTLRGYSADTIREAFGIPKTLLGAQDSALRAGIEGDEYIYAKYVLKPRVNLILNEFNTKLLPMLGSKATIECEELVPQDKKHQLEVAKTFSSGIPAHLTLNEIRKMMDLPPVEGGDALGGVGAPVKVLEPERRVPFISCRTGVFSERVHFEALFKELDSKTTMELE